MSSTVSSDDDMIPDIALTDDSRNRCLQYLLGELDSEQVDLFEEELAESKRLGDELHRQAEAVSMLSDLRTGEEIPAPVQTASTLQAVTLWRIACIAIAVCFAGMVVRTWWQTPDSLSPLEVAQSNTLPRVVADNRTDEQPGSVPEFTLIARAWADSQLPDESGSRHSNTMPNTTGDDDTIGDYFEETDVEVDDANSEQGFSWMFTAVSEI